MPDSGNDVDGAKARGTSDDGPRGRPASVNAAKLPRRRDFRDVYLTWDSGPKTVVGCGRCMSSRENSAARVPTHRPVRPGWLPQLAARALNDCIGSADTLSNGGRFAPRCQATPRSRKPRPGFIRVDHAWTRWETERRAVRQRSCVSSPPREVKARPRFCCLA